MFNQDTITIHFGLLSENCGFKFVARNQHPNDKKRKMLGKQLDIPHEIKVQHKNKPFYG